MKDGERDAGAEAAGGVAVFARSKVSEAVESEEVLPVGRGLGESIQQRGLQRASEVLRVPGAGVLADLSILNAVAHGGPGLAG